MSKEEILEIVKRVLAKRGKKTDCTITYDNGTTVAIGMNDTLTLPALNEIAKAAGDDYIMIDGNYGGDHLYEIWIDYEQH